MQQIYGNFHPQIGELSNALGMLAKKEGQYSEALNYYKWDSDTLFDGLQDSY